VVGIRNSWDNVTFLAVERAHSERQEQQVKTHEDPGEKQRAPSQQHSK
jgi:hypothetical protein